MGCASSRIIARSLSYHQEKRQRGLERKTKSNPLLRDPKSSSNGRDQYLALVCAADALANTLQLQSKSFSSDDTADLATESVTAAETVDKRKLQVATSEQGDNKVQSANQLHERAKSHHWLKEHVVPLFDQKTSDDGHKGFERCRSFHTVEEYDALVERIWLSQLPVVDKTDSTGDAHHHPSEAEVHIIDSGSLSSADDQTESTDKPSGSATNINILIEDPAIAYPWSDELIPYSEPNVSRNGNSVEKGFKRKIISKRLDMLKVPSTIASLRERLPPDGIYSPGSYVTPKFGCYSLRNSDAANDSKESNGSGSFVNPKFGSYSAPSNEAENDSRESIVFSPELVDAFEQSMQQLEAEEECILKHIVQDLNAEENSEEEEL